MLNLAPTCRPTNMHAELVTHLRDPHSSFSIGSYGAIGEFHRRADEDLFIDTVDQLAVATRRGGIRIELDNRTLPVAYETLSRKLNRWQQGVVFCLPDQAATRQRRTVLTELGADDAAIQTEHRVDALFDIGVDARNVDFCIRTGDRVLRKLLRAACGLSIFASGNRIMAAILAANPHRIVQSSLGRVEVYQPIGTDVTPEGPHTHLLPKLLKSARTHSANVPVPKGFIPALGLHPPSSVTDAKGDDKPFEPTQLENFERLMGKWGLAEYCQEKARLRAAIAADMDPEFYPSPQSRIGRTALRVALRQLYRTCPDHSILVHWSERWGR